MERVLKEQDEDMNTIPKFVPKFVPNSRKKRQRKVTFADDHSIVPMINQVCLFRMLIHCLYRSMTIQRTLCKHNFLGEKWMLILAVS